MTRTQLYAAAGDMVEVKPGQILDWAEDDDRWVQWKDYERLAKWLRREAVHTETCARYGTDPAENVGCTCGLSELLVAAGDWCEDLHANEPEKP